jgi:predicted dehydrogenase
MATPLDAMTNRETYAYTRLCQAFARTIQGLPTRHDDVPLPTFADGVAATAILDAARRSAVSGGVVTAIPPRG